MSPIVVPPLQGRREDIPLIESLWRKYASETAWHESIQRGSSPQTQGDGLGEPLEYCRAAGDHVDSPTIGPEQIDRMGGSSTKAEGDDSGIGRTFRNSGSRRQLTSRKCWRFNWNISRTAEALDISGAIYNKMKNSALREERIRNEPRSFGATSYITIAPATVHSTEIPKSGILTRNHNARTVDVIPFLHFPPPHQPGPNDFRVYLFPGCIKTYNPSLQFSTEIGMAIFIYSWHRLRL
jgi:hypothetical protein